MTVPANAYTTIRRHSVDLVEERKLDPRRDRDAARQAISHAVEAYQMDAQLGRSLPLRDASEMVERVFRSIVDYGALSDLFEQPDIEEIFIEAGQVSYIDGSGRLRLLGSPTTEADNRHVLSRLLAETDRRLDASHPVVQARVLDDSARLTAVIPPVSDHLSATFRRYALKRQTLASLVELGALPPPAGGLLWVAMQTDASVVVSGPPGAGKTSLLSAMIAAAPPTHCIRSCEEVRELHVPLIHGSYYEARPAGLDGTGEIGLRDLVKVILAMRPDRIVVGEVRGPEAFELTRAANAGCGFAGTVHANSAKDALQALVNSALMAGENVAESLVRKVFASTIDFVVHLDRDAQPSSEGIRRQVVEILSVVPSLHDDFSTQPIFERPELGARMQWSGALPPPGVTKRLEASLAGQGPLREVLEGTSSAW